MNRTNKGLVVLTVALMGVWGCAQSSTPGPSTTDRLRALEVKNTKLEEDFRAVAAARDQVRRKLAAAEEQLKQAEQQAADQVQAAVKEKEEVKLLLAARTGERDAMVLQFDAFRKNIKELLGQAEAALPRIADPTTTTASEPVTPGPSVSN
jgi:hypothetical protein